MNDIELISQIINAIPYPVVAVDKNNMVVAANQEALKMLDFNADIKLPVSFGFSISCTNANTFGKCGTTLFCDFCKMNASVHYVSENQSTSISLDCIYSALINNQNRDYKISFSASFLNIGEGFIVVTLKEKKALSEIPSSEQKTEYQLIDKSPTDQSDLKEMPAIKSTFLHLEQETINTLFEHCSNAVLLLDINGNLININQRLTELTGLNIDEAQLYFKDQKLITYCKTYDGNELKNCNILQLLIEKKLKFTARFFSKHNPELTTGIEIVPIVGNRNTPSGYLLLVTDLSVEINLTNKVEQSFNALEMSPNECFFVNRLGEIIFENQIARSKFNDLTPPNSPLKIYDINLNTDEAWWYAKCQTLDNLGILKYESLHIDKFNNIYPVSVLIYFIHHKQDELICYYATDISEKKSSEEKTFQEIKINNSLSEITRELTFSDKFESVALLVRQYALEMTNSEFCFLNYYEPENNHLVSTVYSDSDNSYKEEVRIVGSYLADYYKSIFFESGLKRSASQKILNDTTSFLIHNRTIYSFLPFDKMAWSGVFFHDDLQGMIFVAGKDSDYQETDLMNLEKLTNLFSLAINRIHEKAKLIKSNNRLSLAIEVANLGLFEIFPPEDKAVISPQLNKMLGGNNEEQTICLTDLNKMIHPDDLDSIFKVYQDHLTLKTDSFKHNIRSALPGYQYRWYQTTGRIQSFSDIGQPTHIIVVLQDMTEQIELNEQLSRSREEAIAANNAKSAFLARVTHELRTPLNAIIGFTDLLAGNINSPTQLEFLANIKKSSITLLDLISNILDFSKIEAGLLSLSFSPVNIPSLIEEIQQLFTPIIANKQINFIINIKPNIPEYITLDELRLKQILINLIGNAAKFTETGYIKLTVEHLLINDGAINLFFTVEDSGIGIKPSAHQTIFNDFTQQEDQDNRRFGGTGLGLGIVKQLVSLMGGEINLVSEPNKGSCFSFNIPQCAIDKSANTELIVKKPDIVIQSNMQLLYFTLNQTDKELFIEQMGNEWNSFISMPSFKTIDNIIHQLGLLANDSQNQFFNHYANKLDLCKKTYNVNDLYKLIKEIEQIIQKTNS
jgi:signal transduction histidine kinase